MLGADSRAADHRVDADVLRRITATAGSQATITIPLRAIVVCGDSKCPGRGCRERTSAAICSVGEDPPTLGAAPILVGWTLSPGGRLGVGARFACCSDQYGVELWSGAVVPGPGDLHQAGVRKEFAQLQ